MNVQEAYLQELKARDWQPDAAQRRAVDRLQQCYEEWAAYLARRLPVLRRLLARPDPPRGIYLWGGVGRGKSFLMDIFYRCAPLTRKTRLHFHEFMRAVHRQLEDLRGQADPLDVLARRIAKRFRLICLDEFHVNDVADAMILHRLLDQLFANGVQFVMTSNYRPDQLYPDGLHRERMLPTIALLQEKLDLINVEAGIDYRARAMERIQTYHTPLDAAASSALREAFAAMAEGPDESPTLQIEHREIRAGRRAGGVVWFDFSTLCGSPRSQNDYLEIAARFHTVILSDVPKMTPGMASEARRFTWLIDVLYDHKIKLLMSAEAPPDALYPEGQAAGEFHRAVSRIIEMQSRDYLEAPRREVDIMPT